MLNFAPEVRVTCAETAKRVTTRFPKDLMMNVFAVIKIAG
jgi:hypothetical protein